MRLLPPAVPVLAAALALLAAPASARPGDIDRSFGRGGGYVHPFVPYANQIFERANGRILLASGGDALQLTRSGALDEGFGNLGLSGPVTDPYSWVASAVDRSGRLVTVAAAGEDGLPLDVFRFRRGGRPDRSFGPDGRRSVAVPAGISRLALWGAAVDRRNRPLVSATARVGGRTRVLLLRLRSDGALDPAFGDGGVAVGPRGARARPPIVQQGRTLVPVRLSARRAIDRRLALIAFGNGGRPLRAYGRRGRAVLPAGDRVLSFTTAVAPGRGRSVVVVAEARRRDYAAIYVARVGARGRVDRRVGRRGLVRVAEPGRNLRPGAVAVDRRGRILLAANDDFLGRVTVLRLRRGGALDRRFGRRGRTRLVLGGRLRFGATGSDAGAMSVLRGGRILVAGTTYDDEEEFRDEYGNPHAAVTALQGG